MHLLLIIDVGDRGTDGAVVGEGQTEHGLVDKDKDLHRPATNNYVSSLQEPPN